jgi:hypothetical protein
MALQIQNDVLPVYEPVITIAETGEVLTEAQIYDTTLALANRIEFVRQATPGVATDPENVCFISDDFTFVDEGAVAFGTPRQWQGDTPWIVTQTAAGTLQVRSFNTGQLVNHGNLEWRSTSGTIGAIWRKGGLNSGSGSGLRYSRFLKAKCLLRMNNIAAPVKFEFGMKSGSATTFDTANTASITFLYDPATNANWLAKTSLDAGSSAHYADTTVPPVPGSYQKLEILQLDATDPTYQFSINDVVVATKVQSGGSFFIPSGSDVGHACFGGQVPVFASNETIQVDYTAFTFNATNR